MFCGVFLLYQALASHFRLFRHFLFLCCFYKYLHKDLQNYLLFQKIQGHMGWQCFSCKFFYVFYDRALIVETGNSKT